MTDHHIETVTHLKKKLEKGVSFEKTMHILYKLQKIPISIKLLEETGIGFKVRELSKQQKNNDIGKTAKLLTMNWKEYVRNRQRYEQEANNNDDDSGMEQESNHSDNNWDSGKISESSPKYSHAKDRHHSHGFATESDNINGENFNETPRSERSEESVVASGNSHKKKHKKKKKKSKEDNDSDDDEYGEYKNSSREKEKKKSKKRHRENNETEEHHREQKYHKSETIPSNKSSQISCDKSESKRYKSKDETLSSKNSTTSNNSVTATNKKVTNGDDIFGTVLGMSDQIITKSSSSRKANVPIVSRSKSSIHSSSQSTSKSDHSSPVKTQLHVDHLDILNSLPDPNYRPLPASKRDDLNYQDTSMYRMHKSANTGDSGKSTIYAGMKFKGRTQVFAGSSKTVTVPQVYRLQELCIRMLMNHIDKIYEVGDLPYFILKPVLSKCTVQQLRRIEYYNPQLLDETDELWNEFCNKDFKNRHLDESEYETWRDFYHYLLNEREEKLKNITRNINTKQRKAVPERKTQQIDLKTPREFRRRQERTVSTPFALGRSSTSGSSYTSSSSSSKSHSGGQVVIANSKPKTAPLMKKLLQMRQSKFRR